MNDLFREIMSSILISWKIKNHPYLTILLKGFYISVLMFISITMTRILTSGLSIHKIENDLKGSVIFGCAISIILLFLKLTKKIFSSINRYS